MRIYYDHRELHCENGGAARLSYYLLEDRQYGAEIVMERSGKWESASVRRLTDSKVQALSFLRRLVENTVTPCALQDVSSDFLTESQR